jgi:tyrosyl-tRNA synthetase
VRIKTEEHDIVSVLVSTGLCASRGAAKRLIKAGAVKVDGKRVQEPKERLHFDKECILQVGKRKFLRLTEE